MNRLLLFMLCSLMLSFSATAQEKTMYNAQHKVVTNEKKAKFYRIVEQRSDKVYKVEYYEVNGPLMWDGIFTSIDPYSPIQKNTYFPSGKTKKTELYTPKYELSEYYESGQLMNKFTRDAEGYFDGDILSFYEDGSPLRQDSYSAGQLITGKCFDRKGNEVKHYPFLVDASFDGTEYGIGKAFRNFIYQNMNYPRIALTNNITGVVYVGFVVKANCRVDDVEVVKGVSQELDDEAVRLVQLVNGWGKAAKINNVPTDMYYVAPVVFAIQ